MPTEAENRAVPLVHQGPPVPHPRVAKLSPRCGPSQPFNGFPRSQDYGDTFLKLRTAGGLGVADYFTPFDQASDAAGDRDLGSGGALLVDLALAPKRILHLAVGAGKDGNIYIVNRNNLGKINLAGGGNTNIYQEVANGLPGGEFGMPAYANGSIYYGPVDSKLRQFLFFQGALIPSPISSPAGASPPRI